MERLWHKMYRGPIYFGRRGIAVHAISGPTSLRDIKGKALGSPCSAARDAVPRPRSRLRRGWYPTRPGRPQGGDRLRGAGLHRGQARLGPAGRDWPTSRRGGREGSGRGRRRDHDRLGPGCVADAKTAIEVAREFEQIGIYWMEEPFEPTSTGVCGARRRGRHPRHHCEPGRDVVGFRELIDHARASTSCSRGRAAADHGASGSPSSALRARDGAPPGRAGSSGPPRALQRGHPTVGRVLRGGRRSPGRSPSSGCRSTPTAASRSRRRQGSASTSTNVLESLRIDR